MADKAYFLSGSRYVRYDIAADVVDPGYPRNIADGWPGTAAAGFADGVQASVDYGQGDIFFFKGAQYIKLSASTNVVSPEYPKPIAGLWPGLQEAGFDSDLDASANWLDGTLRFFKGSSFVVYDIAADRVTAGPSPIADMASGMPGTSFESSLDAVVVWPDNRAFLFKGAEYAKVVGVELAGESPRDIADGWPSLSLAGFGDSLSTGYVKVSAGGGAGPSGSAGDLSDAFFTELRNVCARIGTAPVELLSVMMSESSVMPSAQNPHGKATGLIQFMPATLEGLGYTDGPDTFRQLTAEEQLPFVERYYRPHVASGLATGGRLYQATFLPATMATKTQPADILCAPGGPFANAYTSNPALDVDHDGAITLGDLEARLQGVRHGGRWNAIVARLG